MKFLSVIIKIFAISSLMSCNASFLDVKPNMQTIVPETLEDYGLLLYDYNTFATSAPVTLNLIGADEYQLSDANYRALSIEGTNLYQKQAYIWAQDIYTGEETFTDWSKGYARILQANVVLDGLGKMRAESGQEVQYNSIKGTALFQRAFTYYLLAQQYCEVYAEQSKGNPGLPLRKVADPTLLVRRSTLEETYRFIEQDLLDALTILQPKRSGSSQLQADQAAVHALLTRVYMQIGDYHKAQVHARSCFEIPHELMDYSKLPTDKSYSFASYGIGNEEILYFNYATSVGILSETRLTVNPAFLALYEPGDIRRQLFFRTNADRTIFKGSYIGNSFYFTGLAIDEVYLNYAECLVRNGQGDAATQILNRLRKRSFKTEEFTPHGDLNEDDCMHEILKERMRQLLFRGTRWEDIRRLNKEDRYRQDITRVVEGQEFRLVAGSERFVWPIPPTAISNGDYIQNPR